MFVSYFPLAPTGYCTAYCANGNVDACCVPSIAPVNTMFSLVLLVLTMVLSLFQQLKDEISEVAMDMEAVETGEDG